MIKPDNLEVFAAECDQAAMLMLKLARAVRVLHGDLVMRKEDGQTNQQLMDEFNYRAPKLQVDVIQLQIQVCKAIYNANIKLYMLVEGDLIPQGAEIGDYVDDATKATVIIDRSAINV